MVVEPLDKVRADAGLMVTLVKVHALETVVFPSKVNREPVVVKVPIALDIFPEM